MIEIKPSLSTLKSYVPNTSSYRIKLDANESKNYLLNEHFKIDYTKLNLYPDSDATALRKKLSAYLSVPSQSIVVGNGSSEMIELLLKTFVSPKDIVLSYEPSFSMYAIYTQIHQGDYRTISTDANFKLNIDALMAETKRLQPKLIFICTPNNPTGQLVPYNDIIKLVKSTEALVVVDEAYIEFSNQATSMVKDTHVFNNLVVLRTFSKAYGLAGIRLGYLVSNREIVALVNRVKSPYNLNAMTQLVGEYSLDYIDQMRHYTQGIIQNRWILERALSALHLKVYPSEANFVFFYCEKESLYADLLNKGILIRSFKDNLAGYYRVTVSESSENQAFIEALKEILS
jgi:histidinol-phosphate aminotransferase